MPEPAGTQGTGLAPNVASFVCYLCPPVTSIVMLLLEKQNKEVQFHGWQATFLAVGYILVSLVLNIVAFIIGQIIGFLGMVVHWFGPLVFMVALILWVVCMVKAYQGERWKIPYLGDYAAQKAGVE